MFFLLYWQRDRPQLDLIRGVVVLGVEERDDVIHVVQVEVLFAVVEFEVFDHIVGQLTGFRMLKVCWMVNEFDFLFKKVTDNGELSRLIKILKLKFFELD